VMGVVLDPTRGELFTAVHGEGVFLNGSPVRLSLRDLSDSLIATGFPFRHKHLTNEYLKLFGHIFLKVSDMRRAGSAALDLAGLACGRIEGFFEIGLSPWDIAAGSVMIKEAGGIITDFGGGNNYLSSGNVVAGSPSVHRVLLRSVKDVFSGIIDK
jgi:myo-inositol-1(or 4)-monophosphatase